MNNEPKILIGTPTYSGKFYCIKEWVENIKSVSYDNFDLVLVDNSATDDYKSKIESYGVKCIKSKFFENPALSLYEARKKFFEYALDNNYDFIFSVEQDVFPPPDTLKRLLNHKKSVIGAPYLLNPLTNESRRKVDWIVSCADLDKEIILTDGNQAMYWLLYSEIKNTGLRQVRSCAFGCTLIDCRVLKQIKPRLIGGLKRFDDYYFFEDCFSSQIKVFADTDILVPHFPSLGGGSGWASL